ncbi:hypothetical protein ACH437_23745 [Streptomyces xinghaiensis]|uniref:hypothetical protein n=1 Tax=Streptomyces xinghaiensis TaxID=1038928 RepID=UPI0037B8270B
MTPEQASDHAALLLTSRLVHYHGLTVEEAATAVVQRRRRQHGPHTHLVTAEAHAVLTEAATPIRTALEAIRPAAKAAAAAMADLTRVFRKAAPARHDRLTCTSPYGPPPPHG